MSIALESFFARTADREAARLARVEWCLRIGAAMCFVGHGAFGIITKAKVRLRRVKPVVRKYYLLYDDLGTLMEDLPGIMRPENETFSSLESWCTPCLQGIKKIGEGFELGEGVQTFAYWMYPLHLTVDLDEGETVDDAAVLSGLREKTAPATGVHTRLESHGGV